MGEMFVTADEAIVDLASSIVEFPDYTCSPRGQLIKESLARTFTVMNPRARVVSNPARAANPGFMVGEFLWYWQGRQDLKMMLHYNKRMKDFSDDGETLNSAYGLRLRHRAQIGDGPHPLSQWVVCKKTLVDDPDSRRAVMLINEPQDELKAAHYGSKDVPCTLALQFFIRENRLHLHVTMRSNDVIWGLTNDIFSFTMFQECMLLDLKREEKFKDIELGNYHHTAGSLHVYERHFEMAKKMDRMVRGAEYEDEQMPALSNLETLDQLCKYEELLRTGLLEKIAVSPQDDAVDWMAARLNEHAEKRRTTE